MSSIIVLQIEAINSSLREINLFSTVPGVQKTVCFKIYIIVIA